MMKVVLRSNCFVAEDDKDEDDEDTDSNSGSILE